MGMLPRPRTSERSPVTSVPAAVPACVIIADDSETQRRFLRAVIEADERFVAQMRAKAGPSKLPEKLAAQHGKDDPLPPG